MHLIYLILFFYSAWASNGDRLPDMGMIEGEMISPQQEKQLGQAFMRYIRASKAVLNDELIEDYINRLGHQLSRHSHLPDQSFYFFILDSPEINAFAGPSGYIGVHSALLLTTKSESELAAVLAHEIAHVSQKHLLRSWYDNSRLSIAQGAALLAAIILGATAGGDAAIAAVSGAQAALQQHQINYTRQNEKEADRIGMSILWQSGFEPHAMATFFERMGKATRLYANRLPEFLRTHPVTNARISEAMDRAEQYGYQQHQDSLDYLLIKTQLKVDHFHRAKQAIRYYQSALKQGRYRLRQVAEYGLALAQHRAHQDRLALKGLSRLSQAYPKVLAYTLMAARVEIALGLKKAAVQRLEKAQKRFAWYHAFQFGLAEAYFKAGQAEKSYRILRRWLGQKRAKNYHLLAEVADRLHKPAESHEYMAEFYYLNGQLEPAITQLRIALQLPKLDFYQMARLEARLNQIEQEKKELDSR